MFSFVDCVILIVLVSLAILIGFIAKFQKWKVKWRERCEKKLKLARHIELDPDLALGVTETTLMSPSMDPKSIESGPNPLPAPSSRPSFLMNAISLVIGFQTSTSIIGLPIEFYYYGARSYQFALCMFIAPVVIAMFFVPFLYKIKSASIYDYLEDKFGQGSRQVKKFTLLLSILFQFVFASLVLFSTAIACMQIVSTDASTHSSNQLQLWMISICLGTLSALLALMGLKSVVLANFFQYLIMVGCNILIIILGIKDFGDYQATNQTSASFLSNFQRMRNVTKESGRGDFFEFHENFRTRYTFWNGLLGLLFNTLPSYCLTQQSFMRIKQAKSVRSARLLVLSIAPIGFFNLVLILTLGLVMSAYFERCGDGTHLNRPGEIGHVNQLFTKFLSQFYSKYSGLFGLFIALLVSSAIGTLSSVLKALSVMLSQEMLKPAGRASTRQGTNSSHGDGILDNNLVANSELSRNASFVRGQSLRTTRPTVMSGADSSDIDNLYEEHLLSIQIGKMTQKRKQRVLKKFIKKREKGARYLSKKVVSILIVVCSMIIILTSVGLYHVPGSLTLVAFSIMNAIHGPVLFIYLCARFNDYSLKRHKYAFHRSTISKLRNFQFIAWDVIASCVLAIIVVETLFIGRLVTSAQSDVAKRFYLADQVVTNKFTVYDTTGFCPYNQTIKSMSQSTTQKPTTDQVNYFYYFYAISFNWYPFIGFFVCCFSLAVFNLSRLFLKMLLNVCLAFKCFPKCC